ncbi:MAG: hypothetical protein KJP04_05400, partial [Arenicella sp.]|nr:hypothetical protein [Arenicella sp.]
MTLDVEVQADVDLADELLIPSCGPHFHEVLRAHSGQLTHQQPQELQINLGKLCNQACHHCHVDAGPKRTEIMTWSTMQKILHWIDGSGIQRVD